MPRSVASLWASSSARSPAESAKDRPEASTSMPVGPPASTSSTAVDSSPELCRSSSPVSPMCATPWSTRVVTVIGSWASLIGTPSCSSAGRPPTHAATAYLAQHGAGSVLAHRFDVVGGGQPGDPVAHGGGVADHLALQPHLA